MKQRIRRDEAIPLPLAAAERDLILDQSFVDGELRAQIEAAAKAGTGEFMIQLTPDELNELLEWIAFAANHAEERSLESQLDTLYDRLQRVENSLDVYEA